MRSFFLLLLSLFTGTVYAQMSTVLMQHCLGDSSNTTLFCMTKTTDGGYITGGWVTANGGDVSGYKGGPTDGWIVKLNQLGGIEWQKCFGGNWRDMIHDIVQMPDGGYVAVGGTASYDGDITSTHSTSVHTVDDAFIVKLTATGQIEWLKCFGGSEEDIFKKVLLTADGGFICVGSSESSDGDVSGHHPTGAGSYFQTTTDAWIVKLSSNGTIVWEKSLGAGYNDQADDIIATSDGNYIVTGEAVGYGAGDISTWYGGADAWLIKISPAGNIIWEKTYGGTQDEHNATIIPATDSGFVVAFLTYSNDGICSGNHSGGAGITDIAMIKIRDDGSLIWSNCYGGGAYEWFGNLGFNDDRRGGLLATADGGYILCGSTSSVDGRVTGLHGPVVLGVIGDNYDNIYTGNNDIWMVKLNQSGNLQWQKCLGGSADDFGQFIVPGSDATQFVILGNVNSNDGDISGNKATPRSNGWIAKIKSGNSITGLVFKDNNLNGIQDTGEPLVNGAVVTSSKPGNAVGSATREGRFISLTDTGAYTTTVRYSPYYSVVPSSVTTPYHSTYYNSDTVNFALQPVAGIIDLVVNGFTPSFVRLGRNMQYKIVVRNTGTVNIPSGVVKFVKDHRLAYQSSVPNVSSVTADTLTWNYTNLNSDDTLSLLVTMRVPTPPAANLNDTLSNIISVTPVGGDVTPSNDTAIIKDPIIGAFDPNDKIEIHAGKISSSLVSSGQYLQYTVRFQNTGNDTAFNVIVTDTLDTKLDWSSLQTIASSHPVNFSVINGNQLTWAFTNINLVDSNRNEPLSHGYVVYEVKPKTNVAVGDVIHNDASIYFDYNFPVETNDAITQVQDNFLVLPVKLISFSGNRQDRNVTLLWRISETGSVKLFEIERSVDGRQFFRIGSRVAADLSTYSFADDISTITQNRIYYRLKIIDQDGSFSYSSVLPIKIESAEPFTVYPNPVRQNALVSYRSAADGDIVIDVIDASGKTVASRKENISKGENIIEMNEFSALPAGSYFVTLKQTNYPMQSKWVLKR